MPKKVKSPTSSVGAAVTGGKQGWESGLIGAQFEEDCWKVNVSFVVGENLEDEIYIKALLPPVQQPLRKLFSVVSWDGMLQKVNELGNPKVKKSKDSPLYYEVTEVAKLLLDAGEELPLILVGKLLKFLLLATKQYDLQRRVAENKVAEQLAKGKTAAPSVKDKSQTKSPGKGDKGKKGPELAAVKKDTKLKLRGEEEDTSKCIDDEPDDGPHHYILVVGFHHPQLLVMLAELGVYVSNVIKITSESYESLLTHEESMSILQADSKLVPEVLEAQKLNKEKETKSLKMFWKYLEPVLKNNKFDSQLSDTARLHYVVKESILPQEWNNNAMMLCFGTTMFEDIACLIYDSLDWRRQHQNYLKNMKLINVPAVSKGGQQRQLPSAEDQSVISAAPTPTGKKKAIAEDIQPPVQETCILTTEVDMRCYNDFLSLIPPECVSVPLILHCMLEQVVATEEDKPPLSEGISKPRADGLDQSIVNYMMSNVLSLAISEEERKKLQEDFDIQKQNHKKEPKYPLLLSCHDEISLRLHQLAQFQDGFDPVKAEPQMLRLLPVAKFLTVPQPSTENKKRLARIQELIHFCTDESVSWSELERVFNQFGFESMKLTEVGEDGELMMAGSEFDDSSCIPWDDPVGFAKKMKTNFTLKNINEVKKNKDYDRNSTGLLHSSQREGRMRQSSSQSSVYFDNREKGSEASLMKEWKEKCQSFQVDIEEIQKTQVRSLRDWCFAEHYDQNIFIQILQNASQMYQCTDMFERTQDNSLFLVFHNPMNHQQKSQEQWDMALHSDIRFRNYLEHVADSISEWVKEEEIKWQADQKKMESEKKSKTSHDALLKSKPTSSKNKKTPPPKKAASEKGTPRPASKAESVQEPQPVQGPIMREGSLKAWKEEQDRLKEEEAAKLLKKEMTKSDKKGKRGSKDRSESTDSKITLSSQKKSPRVKSKEPLKTPEPNVTSVPDNIDSVPPEKLPPFTGYNMGNTLIQVSGKVQSLFPSDGGQIKVESINYVQGLSLIEVSVMKDRHCFFIHITDPRKDLEDEDKDGEVPAEMKKQMKRVSKFGSFSAVLASGINLSFSNYGPSGEGKDNEDPDLVSMLNIPSACTTSVPPTTNPPAATPVKRAKSPKAKSPRAKSPRAKSPRLKSPQGRGTTSSPPTTAETPRNEEPKVEIEPSLSEVNAELVPELPDFQSLNVSCPNGLLVNFFSEQTLGLKSEVLQCSHKILVRQRYPVQHISPCESEKKSLSLMDEVSRVITSQGTVIKYMKDGSTQVLFADGTVSKSPDSGPILKPPTAPQPPCPEPKPQDSALNTKEHKSETNEPTDKKGKLVHRNSVVAVKTELVDANVSDVKHLVGGLPESPAGTWVTTTPSGLRVATKGEEKVQIKHALAYKATDPVNEVTMITREDKVLTVIGNDDYVAVEHADGTRITTFNQDVEIPGSMDHDETGEDPLTVSKKVKFVQIECLGFATLIMNSKDGTCTTVFGDGSTIIANPQGAYQVCPPSSGCLCIDSDGSAVYNCKPNDRSMTLSGTNLELQPCIYTMRHTTEVICEVMDPEGNLFQVMVDGKTSTFISNTEAGAEEEVEDLLQEQTLKYNPVTYKEHAPRFFIVHADGSGTELLRSRDVEDYLSQCFTDPAIAVLKEPLPDFQGVYGITVLHPCTEDIWSHWLIKKEIENIIPPNLKSREWDHFPSTEKKTPGPPFGTSIGKGLNIQERPASAHTVPILKCPKVLKTRQLIQYTPVSNLLRRKMEQSLKGYIDHILRKDYEFDEMMVKDPRTEEERVHATDLLKLVLSLPDSNEPVDLGDDRKGNVDIASLYEQAITIPSTTPPEKQTWPECSKEIWERNSWEEVKQESNWAGRLEQCRQEKLEEMKCRVALKNRTIPPYFESELGEAFLLTQVPDMESLTKQLPPFTKKNKTFSDSLSKAPTAEPGVNKAERPFNPTPSRAGGSDNSTQSAAEYPDMASRSKLDPMSSKLEGMHSEGGDVNLYHSLKVDAARQSRKEKVKLPSAILGSKPGGLPNQKFFEVEDPVRRKVKTVSVVGPLASGVMQGPARGFELFPAEVAFGVLKEGYTYSFTVSLRNVGIDSCRFKVNQPPPSTGLRVLYTPGPVAAGMKTDLQIELYAMAIGLANPEGVGYIAHHIQIQTETEIFFLPVTATVLTENVYESRPKEYPQGQAAAGVRLVLSTPSSRLGIIRPHRQATADSDNTFITQTS
ncbi:sperm-associated antigen 17 [Acipenser ruthenus]|uniref:sperm-associated antigen 17 n=1 Tax=Acipenser ruthenus TaxID=7906 RepID=UPI00274209CB|nr:sperm-associated antigen 17 [Acipenser ruthenus]